MNATAPNFKTVAALLDFYMERAQRLNNLDVSRAARLRQQRETARIVQLYKGEIYDWCGHDLACSLVAEKTGIHERVIRGIIANAGVLF